MTPDLIRIRREARVALGRILQRCGPVLCKWHQWATARTVYQWVGIAVVFVILLVAGSSAPLGFLALAGAAAPVLSGLLGVLVTKEDFAYRKQVLPFFMLVAALGAAATFRQWYMSNEKADQSEKKNEEAQRQIQEWQKKNSELLANYNALLQRLERKTPATVEREAILNFGSFCDGCASHRSLRFEGLEPNDFVIVTMPNLPSGVGLKWTPRKGEVEIELINSAVARTVTLNGQVVRVQVRK